MGGTTPQNARPDRDTRRQESALVAEDLARALALQVPSAGAMMGPIPTPQELAALLSYDIPPEIRPSVGFTFPPEVDRG
jgi:hypothetical protein